MTKLLPLLRKRDCFLKLSAGVQRNYISTLLLLPCLACHVKSENVKGSGEVLSLWPRHTTCLLAITHFPPPRRIMGFIVIIISFCGVLHRKTTGVYRQTDMHHKKAYNLYFMFIPYMQLGTSASRCFPIRITLYLLLINSIFLIYGSYLVPTHVKMSW